MIKIDTNLPAPILYGCDRSYSIEHVVTMDPATHLRDGERALFGMVLPSWQRAECWDMDRKRRFIEGIFLGLGTGYYVHSAFDWSRDAVRTAGAGLLLDGQQRFTALRDFVAGELSIFDGVTYAGLSLADKRQRFLRVTFPSIEVRPDAEEAELRELSVRLAFGGVPHNPSERAVISGEAA